MRKLVFVAIIVAAGVPRVEAGLGSWTFIRGDYDGNGALELTDGIGLLNHLFVAGSPVPICDDAADVNDDGGLGLLDPVYLLTYLFVPGATPPPAPFPTCGIDFTADGMGCDGPIGSCAVADLPPDLVVAFADDALEDTVGIRIHPQSVGVFAQAKFNMRPVTLQVGAATGTVQLSVSDPLLEVYEPNGNPVSLPAIFDVSDLPLSFLVNATDVGQAELTALHSESPIAEIVVFNSSLFPGLAGEEIAAYPHFEYNRTINESSDVQVALDPSRYPARVGLGYRVYVVEHKTPAEWAADNSLVDVSGAFDSTQLIAGSIQDNVTDAWTSGLSGGVEFANAYDVVCDFGNDGTLDPGDLIDGLDAVSAGLYIAKDLTTSGPYAVTTVTYSGGTWLGQRTYYPSNIAALGTLPVIVISHGNGHNYTWYDYLGEHFASHGFIAMAHQNNTGPGITTASTTTLTNTDYLLGNLATIAGGALNGHVQGDNIAWIGHSRGGEGVVVAYHRVWSGSYVPTSYGVDDIRVVSSISPTMFNAVTTTNPHSVNYHLLYGAADGDVAGGPGNSWPFQVYQAATGYAQATYVQGAGHNDFNCCGFADATGPSLIGRTAAQTVAKSYFLALFDYYQRGNPAARDFLTRSFYGFHPDGIPGNVVVANQYRDAATHPNDIIEDYQTQTSTSTSSSGTAVTFDVSNVFEAIMRDGDGSFGWSVSDPMNAMTQAYDPADLSRGVVFNWNSPSFYEIAVPAAMQDLSDNVMLTLRACQGSRHPETVALAGRLDFTITLEDAMGTSSSINFGTFATITRPYQRTGSGSGAGWANEFNTVRVRLTDFETDGSGIDLGAIESIRLEFGSGVGSVRGRLGLDDVQLTVD